MEYQQDNPWLPPGTICTFFVENLRVVDFSGGYNPSVWPPLWADFNIDWRDEWFNKGIEPPTWYMSDDVLDAKYGGLLFPSQANPGGTNLVIYNSTLLPETGPGATLIAYDPGGTLKKLAERL